MKVLKIILGVILSIGLLKSLPSVFEDISNGVDIFEILGEAIAIILIGSLIYYLFSTANNSNINSKDLTRNG